jgi:sugar lactone lactonase YvrE
MPKAIKIVLFVVGAIVTLLVAVLLFVKITRGSGRAYPDVSTEAVFPPDSLEVVASLPLPPGNVAVSESGRVFFNYHYLGSDGDENGHTVFEIVNGEPVPFPDASFQNEFVSTLGMLIDQQNRLWIIDPAAIDGSRNTRLFAFSLDRNTLVYDFTFESDADFAQDIQVTADGRYVIAADTGLFDFIPAKLIVLDTETNDYRVLLSGHESVSTENWHIRSPSGERVSVFWGLIDWQAGVDGITISPDGRWLSYASINHSTMYRLPMDAVLDPSLSDDELAAAIQVVGTKPLSDGLSSDLQGAIYITDIENGGIARMSPGGKLETLVSDPRVRWADGISFGPDSMIYFTDSAISVYLTPTADPPDPETIRRYAPYHIFRFQNDVPGIPGS